MVKFSVYLNRRVFVMFSWCHWLAIVVALPGLSYPIMANTYIGLDKSGYQVNMLLFLHENICCEYSLEAHRRGTFNQYHNIRFRREIRKISIYLDRKKKHLIKSYDLKFHCTSYIRVKCKKKYWCFHAALKTILNN